jgi:polysaccharide biosynthesis transport protein
MRSSGVEELKAALRRSAWLIVALTLVGALVMTLIKQLNGPEYGATAKVVLPSSDLAASLAGIQPVYVDPQRQDQAEQNLAKAPLLYVRASRATGGRYGSGLYMRSVTSVGGSNNVLSFSTTTDDGQKSVGIANALAAAYPNFRSDLNGKAIATAIKQIRAQLRAGASGGSLNDQLQKLNVLRTLNSADSLLVEPALGAAQTTPRWKRDAVVGAAIGLMVALLLAGLRELLDTRVRSETDVEDTLGVPVLGTVPSIPKRVRSRLAILGESRFTDTYELLAANLAQILEGHQRPICLAITSAEPGEGKTTTAANLAVALARRGSSVVLADFDLRKPAVSGYFSIPGDAAGVTEILRGAAGVRSTLWPISLGSPSSVVMEATSSRRATKVQEATSSHDGSLVVLPAGRASVNGAAGAQFAQLPKLLANLKPVADYVIIDTPPALLTAGVAELAQGVNAVLVVVRQGVATRRRLRSLTSRAHSWQPKVVGAVLNDVTRGDSYYTSYYGSS